LKASIYLAVIVFFSCTIPLCAACEEYSDFAVEKLVISDITINYSLVDGQSIVTTIGSLKNTSDSPAENIVVEVKYFDGQKKLIDVATEPLYGIKIPKDQEVAFRVRDVADKEKTAYVSNSVRVVSADQGYVRNPKTNQNSSFWINLLSSWGPMLLLISVWIFFIRKNTKKGSPQVRSVELVEQQNQILTRQLEVLERLAAAAENLKSDK